MNRASARFFGKRKASGSLRSFRPQFESLEERVPLAVTAVLDFTGGLIYASQMEQGGWFGAAVADHNVEGFDRLFESGQPLAGADYDDLIDQIVAKTVQDYAPYDVDIVVKSNSVNSGNDYMPLLFDNVAGDAIIKITGDYDTFITKNTQTGGIAPNDVGDFDDDYVNNNHDGDLGFIFASKSWQIAVGINSSQTDIDLFVNTVATSISHELGHTFGLYHALQPTDPAVTDTLQHYIMNGQFGADPSGGVIDLRRDVTLQDVEYDLNGDYWFEQIPGGDIDVRGTQNAHEFLNEHVDNIGPSDDVWMAVLKPGELTVSGNSLANQISVTPFTSEGTLGWWVTVTVGGSTEIDQFVALGGPDEFSVDALNPFDDPLRQLNILGKGDADTILIDAGFGADVHINGGDGNDIIQGGSGLSFLDGGLGSDTYQFSPQSKGSFILTEEGRIDHNGVEFTEVDTLDLSTRASGIMLDLASAQLQEVQPGLLIKLNTPGYFENVNGTQYSDTIRGNSGRNTLLGFGGIDILEGRGGDDVLDGGAASDFYQFRGLILGSDTIIESDNADSDWLDFQAFDSWIQLDLESTNRQAVNGKYLNLTLSSATGIENVSGSPFYDSVAGNARSNTIQTFAGDDTVQGRGGNDFLSGGTGSDTYVFAGLENLGEDTISEADNRDNDKLDFRSLGTAIIELDLAKNGVVQTIAANLSLLLTKGTGIESVDGTDFNDKILGNARANRLFGYGGDDTLVGRSGNDTLRGHGGEDHLYGNAGADYLDGGDDGIRDWLYAGLDNDRDILVQHRNHWGLWSQEALDYDAGEDQERHL